MVTFHQWVHVLAVILAVLLCACASPRLPHSRYQDDIYSHLHYRDSGAGQADASKPTRADGLGRLLLKNMRFRDVDEQRPLWWILNTRRPNADELYRRSEQIDQEPSQGVSKRQVSVSQLAEILNNLKARNADDGGVKLQSLRFGK